MMSKQELSGSSSGYLGQGFKPTSSLRSIYAAVLRSIFSLESFNTVFIASDGVTTDTSFVALQLAREAAQFGYRVLIIECPREISCMAADLNGEGVPLLVEVGGSVLVAIGDASDECPFYVAPSFKDPLAPLACLSKCLQIDFVKDIAARFDLVLIDGDTADTTAAANWLKLANKTMLVSAGGAVSSRISGLRIEDRRVFLGTIVSAPVSKAAHVPRPSSSPPRKIRTPNRAMSRLFDMKMRIPVHNLEPEVARQSSTAG